MRTALVLLALVAAGPAAAQTFTAGALQGMCSAREPSQLAGCASYIQGYADGRNLSQARASICVPAGRTIGDVAHSFADYMTKNRLEANLPAGLVLGNYLVTNFPCGG
jgi:curli biogenesis system outer membrane secretion channel CsgG